MGNLLSSIARHGTRSSSPLATNDAVPSTSLQGTTPSPSPPPPQGPHNADVGDEAVLRKVIQGLRKHVPKLYSQLRVGAQFDPDVVMITLDIVDKASGGTPWPVRLALQAVLFLADNLVQAHENATAGESLALTLAALRQKLQRLKERFQVPDEHEDELKKITAKLIVASAVIDDIVRRSSSTLVSDAS